MNSTLGDYFIDEIGSFVHAPQVYDVCIFEKGYLFMELMPLNDGRKIFVEDKLSDWKIQKKYFLDVMIGVDKLLNKGIAMTDLKAGNTLFDKDKN